VITNTAAGDVVLFPLLQSDGWNLVAITTAGKVLWSAQTVGVFPRCHSRLLHMLSGSLGAMAPPQVSVDGSQVFVVGLHPTNTSAVYAHDTATGNVLYVLPGS
jgi:hypothetical protein